MIRPHLGEPLRQLPDIAIVDIDQRGETGLALAAGVVVDVLQPGPDDVAERLRPALVAALLDEPIDLGDEVVVESERDALHG